MAINFNWRKDPKAPSTEPNKKHPTCIGEGCPYDNLYDAYHNGTDEEAYRCAVIMGKCAKCHEKGSEIVKQHQADNESHNLKESIFGGLALAVQLGLGWMIRGSKTFKD